MERLSISLDDECIDIINQYLPKYKGSKANLLRRALLCLRNNEELQKKVEMNTVRVYVDFLANMEHVIVDIDHWKAFFTEIGSGSEKFWKEVYDIGKHHRLEYYDKGLKSVRQILEYVEKTNWYKLSEDSEDSYTLILTVSEASQFVKTFFEGFFKEYPRKVEISMELKKIRIRVL